LANDPESSPEDNEKLMFLLLNEVFERGDKELGREYHNRLVELYCKYGNDKLYGFLQKAEAYSMN
jgi:hypothetical protein